MNYKVKGLIIRTLEEFKNLNEDQKTAGIQQVQSEIARDKKAKEMIGMGLDKDRVKSAKLFLYILSRRSRLKVSEEEQERREDLAKAMFDYLAKYGYTNNVIFARSKDFAKNDLIANRKKDFTIRRYSFGTEVYVKDRGVNVEFEKLAESHNKEALAA